MSTDTLNETRYTATKARVTRPTLVEVVEEDQTPAQLDYWESAPFHSVCGLNHPKQRRHTALERGNRQLRTTSDPLKSADFDYLARHSDSSEYHERCVTEKPGRQFTPKPPMTKAELRKADVVSQDKIWREAVTAETDAAGKWQNAWGFLLDYDSKGKPVERCEVQKVDNSDAHVAPITNARNYGSRLDTELGQKMLKLEFQLSHNTRKKKLSSEMICY